MATPLNQDRPYSLGAVLFGIAAVMTLSLAAMGRVWWCEAGDLSPWAWDVWSRHNSQHLLDPYTLSHLEHGLILWCVFEWSLGNKLSRSAILIAIAGIEAVWEIAENTPFMIDRYREATISLDYTGDSILNSLSDYVACLVGALVAAKLGARICVIAVIILEVICLFWIRDSLALNIIMLVYPVEAIREWQSTPALIEISRFSNWGNG